MPSAGGARALPTAALFVLLPSVATAQPHDASRCAREQSHVDQLLCFAAVARDADDPAVCMISQHEGVRWQCVAIYAEHARDAALCDSIPTLGLAYRELRDLCISDVAEIRKEARLCAEIVTPGLHDSCYLKLFRATGDAALCAEIHDPGLNSACTGEPVIVR